MGTGRKGKQLVVSGVRTADTPATPALVTLILNQSVYKNCASKLRDLVLTAPPLKPSTGSKAVLKLDELLNISRTRLFDLRSQINSGVTLRRPEVLTGDIFPMSTL